MITERAPSLRQDIAARIVERISTTVQKHIYVTDSSGVRLAGNRPTRAIREIAVQAIAERAIVRRTAEGGSMAGLPLVYDEQTVGAIVLEAIAPLNDDVAYMARSLAELIIHQMVVVEQLPHQVWAREKFLFDLLHGRFAATSDIVLHEAALLQLELTIPRVVALVAIENRRQEEDGLQPHSTLPAIEKRLRNARREAELLAYTRQVLGASHIDIASFIENRWLVLLPAIDPHTAELDRRDIAAALKRLLQLLAQEHQECATAGVGRYYDGWPSLAQSFADAQFALEIGREIQGTGQVYLPSDLGVASLVCSNDTVLKTQLASYVVQRLVQDSELLHTLDVFVDANLSPSVAAERLFIHRHTLSHRLDKISRLTGLDPRRFHELAQLHAALVLYRTCMHPTYDLKPTSHSDRARTPDRGSTDH